MTVEIIAYRVARELYHRTCVPPGEVAHRVRIADASLPCANCDQPLGKSFEA